ncbi:hypothetical protein Mapa_000460 [Marchantia paleacea]|nr:hypothetical protein Mapa_000460 [Marchantia paleacea]
MESRKKRRTSIPNSLRRRGSYDEYESVRSRWVLSALCGSSGRKCVHRLDEFSPRSVTLGAREDLFYFLNSASSSSSCCC